MSSQDPILQERARSNSMHHPASLPPRPRHTFSLRTVERLQQQNLASNGAHVRPEQIPAYVERMRSNLSRVENALRYRAAHGSDGYQTLLSKFERVRVGQILADTVLDIVTISIASSNETYDAVVSPRTALSLATPRVDETPLFACVAEDYDPNHQHMHASEYESGRAPPPISLMPLDAPSVPSTSSSDSPRDAQGKTFFPSFSESSLSVRFKPVLSMCSGADGSIAAPPPRHKPQRPRRYYDIDLQRLSAFTQCLQLVHRMRFTDSDFEELKLRYAIPGIRELNRGEEKFFGHSGRTDISDRVGERGESVFFEEHFEVKRNASVVSTGGGTEADTEIGHGADSYGTWRETPQGEDQHSCSPSCADESQANSIRTSSTPNALKDHYLDLFHGGWETIVQAKDLHIFIAMVDMRLTQVDQDIGGRISAARAHLPLSSGDRDTFHSVA